MEQEQIMRKLYTMHLNLLQNQYPEVYIRLSMSIIYGELPQERDREILNGFRLIDNNGKLLDQVRDILLQ